MSLRQILPDTLVDEISGYAIDWGEYDDEMIDDLTPLVRRELLSDLYRTLENVPIEYREMVNNNDIKLYNRVVSANMDNTEAIAYVSRRGSIPLTLHYIRDYTSFQGAVKYASSANQINLIETLFQYEKLDEYITNHLREIGVEDGIDDYKETLKTLLYNIALENASKEGHIELVSNLLRMGADDYETAISESVLSGNLRMIQYLISMAPENIEIDIRDSYDRWLALASKRGYHDIIDYFLRTGGLDINYALHETVKVGRYDTVRYLIEKGANDYDWALRIAKEYGHDRIAELLVSMGAVDETDETGEADQNNYEGPYFEYL